MPVDVRLWLFFQSSVQTISSATIEIQSAGRLSIARENLQNAKRRARIFGVDDAKESESRNAVVQGKPPRDRDFGDAIESDDEQGDQKMIFAHDRKEFFLYFIAFAKTASRTFNFLQHGAAALAHRGIVLVLADAG